MTALLAYLRGRPWLAPCLMIMGIGLSLVAIGVDIWHLHLLFWFGIAAIVGGLLIALGGQIGYRRQRTGRQAADTHS